HLDAVVEFVRQRVLEGCSAVRAVVAISPVHIHTVRRDFYQFLRNLGGLLQGVSLGNDSICQSHCINLLCTNSSSSENHIQGPPQPNYSLQPGIVIATSLMDVSLGFDRCSIVTIRPSGHCNDSLFIEITALVLASNVTANAAIKPARRLFL